MLPAARAFARTIHDRADAEWREDVRRDLETELAPDRPGLLRGRVTEIDFAAHDHVVSWSLEENQLLLDAERVGRILVAGNGAGTLEVAERGTAPGIDKAP